MGASYYMRRKIRSGKVTEVSQFFVGDRRPRKTRVKGSSSAAKKDRNLNDAVRRLARILNCNLTEDWIFLTLTYSEEALPSSPQEAVKRMQLFLRRLRSRGVRFAGVWITADKDSRTAEIKRLHHHVVISGQGISLTGGKKKTAWAGGQTLEDIWGSGIVLATPIEETDDYTQMAVYLVRQAVSGEDVKKWHTSRDLKQPEIISEEIIDRPQALRAPGGADVKEITEYDEQSCSHYIRYVAQSQRSKSKDKDLDEYLAKLKKQRSRLTRQQILTLRGQALAGDIAGAEKGLARLTEGNYGK